MENKKIIIITIVLFLLAGTGTFVFASNQGDFNEEDIDYRTDKDPTYEKVDGNNNNNVGGSGNNNQGIVDEDIPPISNPGETEDQDETNNNGNGATNSGNSSSSNNNTSSGSGNNSNGSNNNSNSGNNNNNSSGSGNNTGGNNSGNNNQGSTGDTNKPEDKPIKPEEPVIKDTAPPVLKIRYNTTNATKGPVIVTIEANEPIKALNDWSLANDKLSISKAFSNNGSGQVIVYDEAGNSSTIEYNIQNIDNIAPKATVETSNNNGNKLTFRDIIVTITTDEDIRPVAGWELKDNRILTKTFSGVAEAKYSLMIYDLVGNEKEVGYEIRNYNPKRPELIAERGESETTITMTYKEPLDDTWIQNEEGEYTKVNVIPNNNDETISITMPDGVVQIYEAAPIIDVYISNRNADGTSDKTNQPVEIKLNANKEILALENWNLSEDKKDLFKVVYKVESGTITVYDLAGNSTTIKYSITNVDAIGPEIIKTVSIKNSDGTYTIKITTSELAVTDNKDWIWSSTFTVLFKKTFIVDDLRKGVIETLNFKDKYDNHSTQTIKINYIDGNVKIEVV